MDTRIKIRPRTKYAIIFGIIGFFTSFFVMWFIFGFVWLFIAGDNPSPIQELIGNIILWGFFVVTWFFTTYLGYRLGKDNEKSLNNLG